MIQARNPVRSLVTPESIERVAARPPEITDATIRALPPTLACEFGSQFITTIFWSDTMTPASANRHARERDQGHGAVRSLCGYLAAKWI